MKKITFLILSIFVTTNIYSQIYVITFTANGASTTLDSVKVENITQSTEVMCYTGDVLHLILNSTSVNKFESTNESINVYPNPVQDLSEISFFVKQQGMTTLSIYDVTGKEVLKDEKVLSIGIHKYNITGLKQGVYLINISGKDFFYTSKIISRNSLNGVAQLQYIGSEQQEVVIKNTKSTKGIVVMDYTAGDNLIFTGYAGNFNVIVNDVPTESKNIDFVFNSACGQLFEDNRDGNMYPTVHLGNQCWFAKNLAYLPLVHSNSEFATQGNNSQPGYGVYGYDGNSVSIAKSQSNYATFGVLYNWFAAMAGATSSSSNPSGIQGICPSGWHLPSDAEWTQLTDYLSSNSQYCCGGISTRIAKSLAATTNWITNSGTCAIGNNLSINNSSGFTALPGGDRYNDGTFGNVGNIGDWWGATEDDATDAWYRSMYYSNSNVTRGSYYKKYGFSVRCVRDL